MQNNVILSHKPSYENIVFLNFSLSPIIKNVKNSVASKNEIMHTPPSKYSFFVNKLIPLNKGKNNSDIKPIAEEKP